MSKLANYFISSIDDDYKNIVMRFYYFPTITTSNHHKKYKNILYIVRKKGMNRDEILLVSSILFASLRKKPQICFVWVWGFCVKILLSFPTLFHYKKLTLQTEQIDTSQNILATPFNWNHHKTKLWLVNVYLHIYLHSELARDYNLI